MLNQEEYVLLIVKPDGVKKKITDDAVTFFETKGLKEVFRNRKKLARQFVESSFSAKCQIEDLQDYLSSGDSDAVLLKGENAYDIVRLGKVEYRKEKNVNGEIENMIHSPEAGNEYVRQFSYFFPQLNGMYYCMYADFLAKPFYCEDRQEFIDALIGYDSRTNSKLVYVFQEDEFENYRQHFNEYIKCTQRNEWLFGIEYLCEMHSKTISIIGYYKAADVEKTVVSSKNKKCQVTEQIKRIRDNFGIAYIGFSRDIMNISDEEVQELKENGVLGIVLYHPNYTVGETSIIRERFLPQGYLMGGGSGGITEPGSFSVSYTMLQSLYDSLYT